MKNKKPKKINSKDKDSIQGLLAQIDRIEKKLNLLSTLGKAMPSLIISTIAILLSVTFLSFTANIQESINQEELPQTGEEITTNFVILYPEDRSSISLPDQVIGLSLDGFLSEDRKVIFYAKSETGVISKIGQAERGIEQGKYQTYWDYTLPGKYLIWAEISKDGIIQKSQKIEVNIK